MWGNGIQYYIPSLISSTVNGWLRGNNMISIKSDNFLYVNVIIINAVEDTNSNHKYVAGLSMTTYKSSNLLRPSCASPLLILASLFDLGFRV